MAVKSAETFEVVSWGGRSAVGTEVCSLICRTNVALRLREYLHWHGDPAVPPVDVLFMDEDTLRATPYPGMRVHAWVEGLHAERGLVVEAS